MNFGVYLEGGFVACIVLKEGIEHVKRLVREEEAGSISLSARAISSFH